MTAILSSGLLGAILGAAAFPAIRRSLRTSSTDRHVLTSVVLVSAMAGAVVAIGANGAEVVVYIVFATFGTALAVVDVLEQRLPSRLTAAGWIVVAVLLLATALLDSRLPDLVRALVASAVLATGHMLLALAVPGGLGAGDVKLAMLVGLPLGYISWSSVVLGTVLGWTAGAIAMLLLRPRRHLREKTIPMGPFMVGAAVVVIGLEANLRI